MEQLTQIISMLNVMLIPSIRFTFLDFILLLVFIFYAFEGYSVGFMQAVFDLLSFVFSFFLGLKTYTFFANILALHTKMPMEFAKAAGFFIASVLFETVLGILGRKLAYSISNGRDKSFTKLNKILGIIPSLFSAFVLLSFILSLIISLPLSPFLKHTISDSRIGSLLVSNTSSVEKSLNSIFGGAINQTLNFFTVEPQSNEMVQLHFSTTNVSVDSEAEAQMLTMVNKERTSRGFSPLTLDMDLSAVARVHSKDMFARGYFSHYTPDGLSPFDRMSSAN